MKDIRPEQLPLARTEQLIVKEVDDEVLVYDLKTDQAHCLNKTAANVWRNCDGEKSLNDITTALANDSGTSIDEGVVWLALDQLNQFKLLAELPKAPAVFAGMSRRQVMRNIGIAVVALPLITSIVSPTPAMATSVCGVSGSCANPAQCTNPACPTCNGAGKCV